MHLRIVIISALIAMAGTASAAPSVKPDDDFESGGMTVAPIQMPPIGNAAPPRIYRGPPATLEEARARARQRLEDLEKMTEQDWVAEQQYKGYQRTTWDRLSAAQKEAVLKISGALEPVTERLPDLTPHPATPETSKW